MNRLLIIGAAGTFVLLALWRPASSPGIAATASAPLARPPHAPSPARTGEMLVYVAGAVRRPGLYHLAEGARADDAVRMAGGLSPDADPLAVNLAEPVTDGEEIAVERVGQTAHGTAHIRRAKTRRKRASGTVHAAAVVDLNSANALALAALPGIGETLAERIVAYRDLNGPFASLDELADVAGMTQRRIDALAAYVMVR